MELRNQNCTFNTEDISLRTSIKPAYTRVSIGPSEESENDVEMDIKIVLSKGTFSVNGKEYDCYDNRILEKIEDLIKNLIKARYREEEYTSNIISLSQEEWNRRSDMM